MKEHEKKCIKPERNTERERVSSFSSQKRLFLYLRSPRRSRGVIRLVWKKNANKTEKQSPKSQIELLLVENTQAKSKTHQHSLRKIGVYQRFICHFKANFKSILICEAELAQHMLTEENEKTLYAACSLELLSQFRCSRQLRHTRKHFSPAACDDGSTPTQRPTTTPTKMSTSNNTSPSASPLRGARKEPQVKKKLRTLQETVDHMEITPKVRIRACLDLNALKPATFHIFCSRAPLSSHTRATHSTNVDKYIHNNPHIHCAHAHKRVHPYFDAYLLSHACTNFGTVSNCLQTPSGMSNNHAMTDSLTLQQVHHITHTLPSKTLYKMSDTYTRSCLTSHVHTPLTHTVLTPVCSRSHSHACDASNHAQPRRRVTCN